MQVVHNLAFVCIVDKKNVLGRPKYLKFYHLFVFMHQRVIIAWPNKIDFVRLAEKKQLCNKYNFLNFLLKNLVSVYSLYKEFAEY